MQEKLEKVICVTPWYCQYIQIFVQQINHYVAPYSRYYPNNHHLDFPKKAIYLALERGVFGTIVKTFLDFLGIKYVIE